MFNFLRKIKAKIKNSYWYNNDYKLFQKLNDGRFVVRREDAFPCWNDKLLETNFDKHYIYHPAWAARILSQTKPDFHVDISSTLFFCSIVSAFLPIKFYDFRPAKLNLSNLSSDRADLCHLDFQDNSIKSLSCMHTVEHIGLGRYGDKIDPSGDLKAMKELERVLAKNGDLLLVVPVGKSKLMFNAHRIYSYDQIVGYFTNLKLVKFSLVQDSGDFIENAKKIDSDCQNYGCGCFWFKKG